MRTDTVVLVQKYKNALFAAAFSVCINPQDAEDAVQETFIKYHSTRKEFESEEHIKAWLLRVAINQARDISRSFFRKNSVALEEYMETLVFPSPEGAGLFECVMGLPEKHRVVLHLFYYEDYSVKEIAELLPVREGSVKTCLIVGLNGPELESYGYAEFVKGPDGSGEGGHAHNATSDAAWLEEGKAELDLPW